MWLKSPVGKNCHDSPPFGKAHTNAKKPGFQAFLAKNLSEDAERPFGWRKNFRPAQPKRTSKQDIGELTFLHFVFKPTFAILNLSKPSKLR
jgi:hypothetical protein